MDQYITATGEDVFSYIDGLIEDIDKTSDETQANIRETEANCSNYTSAVKNDMTGVINSTSKLFLKSLISVIENEEKTNARIDDLDANLTNVSNIIGISSPSFDMNRISEIGPDLFTATSNIAYIHDDNPDKLPEKNQYIIRYGDLEGSIPAEYEALYELYSAVMTLTPINEDTLFVVVNNTYPFPYEIIKYITEEPFPLFGKDKINAYERFTSTITTEVVEVLKTIIAEHELRISVAKFNSSINPADIARIVAKIATKITAGASYILTRILAKLVLKFNPTASLFQYQRLEDYTEDVVDSLIDVVNEERVIQTVTNAGTSASILAQQTEIKFIFACLASLTGITAFNTALSAGNTFADVMDYFGTSKVQIKEDEIRVLARFKGYVHFPLSLIATEPIIETITDIAPILTHAQYTIAYRSKGTGNILKLAKNTNSNFLEIVHKPDAVDVSIVSYSRNETRFPRVLTTDKEEYTYPNETQVRIIASSQWSFHWHQARMAFNGNSSDNVNSWLTRYGYNSSTGTALNTHIGSHTPDDTTDDYAGEWIMIDLGELVDMLRFSILPTASSHNRWRMPNHFRWYGSDDPNAYNDCNHASWSKIFEKNANATTAYGVSGNFTTTKNYRRFMMVARHLVATRDRMSIGDIELYGKPADGVYPPIEATHIDANNEANTWSHYIHTMEQIGENISGH